MNSVLNSYKISLAKTSSLFGALIISSLGLQAQNLVVNGDFNNDTPGQIRDSDGNGNLIAGWTVTQTGPNVQLSWIFNDGVIGRAGVGVPFPRFNTIFNLWGTPDNGGNGGNYTGTLESMDSPTGDNFFVADADVALAPEISQTIDGLTVDAQYLLTFDWAAGQQFGQNFFGATTESWQVTFGSEVQSTETLNNPSQDFQPWRQQSMTFTATQTSQVLRFLSVGGPGGMPPMALLDNISLTAVPEPGTTVLITSIVALSIVSRRRRRS